MALFIGYFILTCGVFYLFFSIYNFIYVYNLCKFMAKDESKDIQKFLASKKDDAELILIMNLVSLFISFILSLLAFSSVEERFFNILYLIICFIIFIIASFILHKRKIGSKLYLRVKDLYILDTKLNEIKELINTLESRKKILTTYDEDDKYRSTKVIDEELKDLELSIELLKEMYSNIELNYSYKQINDLFNTLKNEDVFVNKSNLNEFQNKVDTINARKILDKNLDIDLENLKKKYN